MFNAQYPAECCDPSPSLAEDTVSDEGWRLGARQGKARQDARRKQVNYNFSRLGDPSPTKKNNYCS